MKMLIINTKYITSYAHVASGERANILYTFKKNNKKILIFCVYS